MKVTEVISPLNEAAVPKISKQQAIDRGMFGPVYHGTDEAGRTGIAQDGFKISNLDQLGNRNGYIGPLNGAAAEYGHTGIPAPIHHFGFGIYFTPSKAVAKRYNQNSTKGLIEYYLDVPRLEQIRFQSPNTMMRWWLANGYDFDLRGPAGPYIASHPSVIRERYRATMNLTNALKAKFDAIYLKGSAYRRAVDDEQVVVFDPSRIYQIDPSLSSADNWEIGSAVVHNQRLHYSPEAMAEYGLKAEKQPDGWTYITRPWPPENPTGTTTLLRIPPPGMKGVIVAKTPYNDLHAQYQRKMLPPAMQNMARSRIDVKWQKGGVQHGYNEAELDPAPLRKARVTETRTFNAPKAVRDLITRHGGRTVRFADLPPLARKAIVTRKDELMEPGQHLDIPPDTLVGYVEIPIEELKPLLLGHVQADEAPFKTFDEYHKWYISHGHTPNHRQVWPIELDTEHGDVIHDGSHRFHSYVRSGLKVVPAIYTPWGRKK